MALAALQLQHMVACKGTYLKLPHGYKMNSGPAKTKPKLSLLPDSPLEEHASSQSMHDSILAFPTNDQIVPDTTLKDVLVSQRSTIHTDILLYRSDSLWLFSFWVHLPFIPWCLLAILAMLLTTIHCFIGM